jgi:dephospho-CoA kinase
MIKVGLTGGIGSGKSIVCKVFSILRVPVYQADAAAKRLYDTDDELRTKLTTLFGAHLYASGVLNRQALAEIIFSDDEHRKTVNRLVHPAVKRDFIEYLAHLSETTPYVIHEAAILFEAHIEHLFDVIINVSAPENLKIKRVLARENTTEENIRRRIAAQWSDEMKIERADYNIVNDDRTPILPQILHIHNELTGAKG